MTEPLEELIAKFHAGRYSQLLDGAEVIGVNMAACMAQDLIASAISEERKRILEALNAVNHASTGAFLILPDTLRAIVNDESETL